MRTSAASLVLALWATILVAAGTTVSAAAPPVTDVTPGAFCDIPNQRGVTKTGKPMICATTATDGKLRWRDA
ncbi:hypothetical protein ACWDSJ_31545 [Nocardia sp. NPDC003482]|uniref:hypothetical protein n=1 Tax=Nocardia sp. NPDC004068 TaxID=3364303 RepID=UPI00369FEE72